MDRGADGTRNFSLSTCLGAHREPHKNSPLVGLERETEGIRSGSKKGGLEEEKEQEGEGKEDMKG